MLKPSDVNFDTVVLDLGSLRAIEEQFDNAIMTAAKTGSWPAFVGRYRDSASNEEIGHVAEKYRAEGWIVMTGGIHRATIDHPSRKG